MSSTQPDYLPYFTSEPDERIEDIYERIEDIYARLDLLAEKTAQGLAHLAVAIVELQQPTLRQRLAALFRTYVYDGTQT